MGENAVLEPSFYFKVPDCDFCPKKTLTGTVLSISENLKFKVERSGSLDDQM